MKTELVQYVRKNGNLIGAVVGVKIDSQSFGVGWSQCNINKGDIFDKNRALIIARGRAIKGTSSSMPINVREIYSHMVERCNRYFQGLRFRVFP
jgi:hypothetical protein